MSSNTIPTKTNLAACRFDYEYMGRSVEEVVKIYGFSEGSVRATINQDGWERKISIGQTTPDDTGTIEDFAKSLKDITRARLTISGIFTQVENQPMMMAIEKTLLEKISLAAEQLDVTDDRAVQKIASMVSTLQTISQRNPVVLADALDKDGEGEGGVKVYIQNQIQ